LVSPSLLAPDGKTAAMRDDRTIQLADSVTGRVLRRWQVPDKDYRLNGFSADGKTLTSVSEDGTLRQWDTATGKQRRQHALWAAKKPRPPTGFVIEESLGLVPQLPGRLALSPDGSSAAWVVTKETLDIASRERTDAGSVFTIRDLAGSKDVLRLEASRWDRHNLVFSPDGKVVALSTNSLEIELWETRTGKKLPQSPQEYYTAGLAFSTDGKLLASAHLDGALRLWVVATGDEVLHWAIPVDGPNRFHLPLAFAPDGKTLAAGCGRTIRLWEVATGQEILPFPGHRGMVYSARFTPDGRRLISRSMETLCVSRSKETQCVWDRASWQEKSRKERLEEYGHPAAAPENDRPAALGENDPVAVRQRAAEKLLRRLQAGKKPFAETAVSPDGRLLAASTGTDPIMVSLWEVETGRPLRQFEDRRIEEHPGGVECLAFSPDGRTLALAVYPDPRLPPPVPRDPPSLGLPLGTEVRLLEVATGGERRRLEGHTDRVSSLAFSPDGKVLVSGSADTTLLVWDLWGLRRDERPTKDLATVWQDLADADAARGDRAIRTLVAVPAQAVPWLRERLRPMAAGDRERIKARLAELDSNEFEVREQATAALMQLEEMALPGLQEVLKGKPSLEVRRRVEVLVARLEQPVPPGPRLRALRALEVLEAIGTPEARKVLEGLAQGAPEARLTQEAKASLLRLDRRSATNP
jgi:WD40 repeat protein